MPPSSVRRRRTLLHFGRFGEILSVFVKYGFGDIVASLDIDRYQFLAGRFFPRRRDRNLSRKLSRWERVRRAIEELGPTFVKLGQFLSNRPDLLPAELITELEKLQDASTPFSAAEAALIITQDLGRSPDELFAHFSPEPIATGSIAQVHQARLVDGTLAAVKIQRPRIRQIVSTDMDILYHLAQLLEKRYESARAVRVSMLAAEFEKVLEGELDFAAEAAHVNRFGRFFASDRQVRVPRVLAPLSSKRVLTTDFITGTKVSRTSELREQGIDTADVARRGARIVVKQVFEHGFFHADPHPGNILILPDGSICFLDFGAVGIVPPTLRFHLGVLLYGFINHDPQRVVKTLSRLAHEPVEQTVNLEYDIAEFIEEYAGLTLREIRLGDVLRRFTRLITDYRLSIVPGFFLLMRALVAIEGVGRRLDPDFAMIEQVAPSVKKLLRRSPTVRLLPYEVYFSAIDLFSLLKGLPYDLQDIMRLLRSGNLRIQYEHHGLEPLVGALDRVVNRLVFAIVLAALIVGSSLVVLSQVPPLVHDIPVIGIAGFVLAGIIGFGLLFSILRGRRL